MAGEERPSSKFMPKPVVSEVKASEPVVEAVEAGPIKVVAIHNGWYKCTRRSVGEVFTIENSKQLGKWMQRI